MNKKQILALAGLLFALAGCGPIGLSFRTLVIEPAEYCTKWNSLVEMRRDHRLAEDAWREVAASSEGHVYSKDYAQGFISGYEDYLYAGGNGAPPPLPPRSYWKAKYQNPEGRVAIDDWFAGFRHGVSAAQESGYRRVVLVPYSTADLEAPGQRLNPVISGPPRDFPLGSTLLPPDVSPEAILPAPRESKDAHGPPQPAPDRNSEPAPGAQDGGSPRR